MGPRLRVIGPSAVDGVPRNVHVRVESPNPQAGVEAQMEGRLVLRAHAGAEVPVKAVSAPDGQLTHVELVPETPLAADTLYEVALVEGRTVPPNRVLSVFRTGNEEDHTAPVVRGRPDAVAFARKDVSSAACQVPGPWVEVRGLVADDPSRPDAKLVWAVWASSSPKVDTSKPPLVVREARREDPAIHVGASSLCDPHLHDLPKGPVLYLAIAAVDEAGNASAPQRVTMNLGAARKP